MKGPVGGRVYIGVWVVCAVRFGMEKLDSVVGLGLSWVGLLRWGGLGWDRGFD